MTRGRAIAAAAGLAVLLVAGQAAALTPEEILLYRGADREQRLLDGARNEGEVVIYSAMIVNQALRPLALAFREKYPFIKLTYWRADPESIMAKLGAEVRAGNVLADVVEGNGIGELAVQANLALHYDVPAVTDYAEQYRDPQHYWTATRLSYYSLAYNTRQVPADKVPKTYADLLDPAWKDKMAWRVEDSTGADLFITNLRVAWGEDKALAYLKRLKDQRLVNFSAGSARTLVDRVLAGEYAIALNIFAHHPLISAAQGAPVNSRLLDPVPSTASTMVIAKGLRHPYAAALLADFILSTEGQEILAKAEYFPARADVPPLPGLRPVIPRDAGVPEDFLSPQKFLQYTDSSEKIFQDIFR